MKEIFNCSKKAPAVYLICAVVGR